MTEEDPLSYLSNQEYIQTARKRIQSAYNYLNNIQNTIETINDSTRASLNTEINGNNSPELGLFNEIKRGIELRMNTTKNSSINIGANIRSDNSIEYDRLEKEYDSRSSNSNQQVQELQSLETQETTKQYFNIISIIIIIVIFVNLIASYFTTPAPTTQTGGLKFFTRRTRQ
jgi:hypothetical protein